MRSRLHVILHVTSITAVAAVMLRGVGEFASLQRWRVREWMAR